MVLKLQENGRRVAYRVYMRFKTWFCVLVTVLAASVVSLRAEMSAFVGKWSVDVPATLKAMKTHPKYDPAEAAQMERTMTKTMQAMSLTVDAERITTGVGKREQSLPYVVESEEGAVTKVRCQAGEKTVLVTLTSLGEGRMNLKASSSGDMDYYVWKPATGPAGELPTTAEVVAEAIHENHASSGGNVKKTIEANLRAILFGAEQYGLENGTTEVAYAALLAGQYFKEFKPVNGESYASVKIDLKAGVVSVADQDGVVYSVTRR